MHKWFPKDGFGLFIHFGLAAVHGGIDLSWGMYANKPWEDGKSLPLITGNWLTDGIRNTSMQKR